MLCWGGFRGAQGGGEPHEHRRNPQKGSGMFPTSFENPWSFVWAGIAFGYVLTLAVHFGACWFGMALHSMRHIDDGGE